VFDGCLIRTTLEQWKQFTADRLRTMQVDLVECFFVPIDSWRAVFFGVALWGLHMGVTQGLLATMVTDSAPPALRGTAFGFFDLFSG
jgi:hypothetical protein